MVLPVCLQLQEEMNSAREISGIYPFLESSPTMMMVCVIWTGDNYPADAAWAQMLHSGVCTDNHGASTWSMCTYTLAEWVSALHFCASEIFSRCARAVAIRKFLSHRELSALLVIQMNYNIYAHSECAHVYTPSDLHCFGVSVFETLVRYSHKDALLWAAATRSGTHATLILAR